ncbi:MAG TPA: hypothetical protein VEK57_03130 [Thermoanaerobaculia bacterium]|nr:hypothetical protein [Thermoanaerobaculia bacterium]
MSPEAETLRSLTLDELANVPIRNWGYFFPFMIAFWKYIEAQFPGTLGELRARYAEEPELEGYGAEWFLAEVMNHEELLDIIEPMSYAILNALPGHVVARGFLERADFPPIPDHSFERLAAIIADEVRRSTAAEERP